MTCFWHGDEEQIAGSFYRCVFCKHVFRTEADFRRKAFEAETPEYDDNGKEVAGFSKQAWPDDTKTTDITWCPFCGGQTLWGTQNDQLV